MLASELHQTPSPGNQTAHVPEWAWDATRHTMQKIPLQGYFVCAPGLLGLCPFPPLCLHPLTTPSPPLASRPAPAHKWGSCCERDVAKEGREGSPPPEVGWTSGREWQSWALAGMVGAEGRQMGRPWGRCSMGCLWWEARDWQRKGEASTRRSGRTRWAAVAREAWGRQAGSHHRQSGRSIQRRLRGPRGTRSGGGNEGGAGGRWSDDCDTAFLEQQDRGRRKEMEEDNRRGEKRGKSKRKMRQIQQVNSNK